MNRANVFAILTAAIGALAVASCSHDDHDHTTTPHSSPYPTCDAIIKQCHPLDVGEGPIHTCHDVAHGAKSDADCVPKKDECLRVCAAADGGGDARTNDGASDTGSSTHDH
jgi:hypothetical protein